MNARSRTLILVAIVSVFAGNSLAQPAEINESVTKEEAQETSEDVAWHDRLEFSGDFRSRYEGFYQEGRQTRNRSRLRLRLRVNTQINDDATFQLQVASGDPGTPVSTNQTFTSFFRPKPFNLDRAYLAYNPKGASALTLGTGKFGPPQKRTQLLFDDDLNFEGGWEQASWSPSPGIHVNLIAMQTAVNEVSRGADSYMLMGYSEVRFERERTDFQISVANYGWGNPHTIVPGHLNGPLGVILTNEIARDTQGQAIGYTSGFNVVDVIGEATVQTDRPGYPLRFLVEFAHNTHAANDRASGWWFEAEYGSPREPRTWGTTYTYGWLEQDLTPSAFVFSDIPGTNLRLHMIETSYVPKTGLSFDITLHLTRRLFIHEDDLILRDRIWLARQHNLLSRLHVAIVARF